jgi:PAS domain S-box-containing protein
MTEESRASKPRKKASRASAVDTASDPFEAGDLYRLFVESVEDYAIFALDTSGHIRTWNRGAERSKGYTAAEITGKHFSVFYPPEDIAAGKPERELEIATREGRVEDEGWRIRKDGTRFWSNVVISALRDETGKLIGFGEVTRDLTQRLNAEEELRRSTQQFRLLVQNVKDYGIFVLDPKGTILTWNEGARAIKGYEADEIIGKHFSIFYPEEDVKSGKPDYELVVAADVGRFEDLGWRLRKDGTRFWANVIITALRDSSGELIGYAKVTRDLTKQRAAEIKALEDARRLASEETAREFAERENTELKDAIELLKVRSAELQHQTEVAQTANRVKAEFLAAMSHELRTPLNAIGGFTQLISLGVHGPVTDQQQDDLERIRRSQQHLLAIINDILNFSRVEAGFVQYESERVSLRETLEHVAPMIDVQAQSKGIEFKFAECPANAVALADAAKTEQILLNILSNGVKFTESGSVNLMCEVVGDVVQVRVTDTGPGVPADKLDAIFEPFVQVGRTLTSRSEGTGLGLAISRDLARGMHGDLNVESQLGEGSTFTLTLPRYKAEPNTPK